MKNLLSGIAFALLVTLWHGGCVKVETGATVEEATQSSEDTAGRIRREWASRIKQVSPPEAAALLVDHYDRVTALYLRYGQDMVEQWREGEQGRGQPIPATEMWEKIDQWTLTQRPILTAYDDNLEFAYRELSTSGLFNDDFLQMLRNLVDEYYVVYSAVFLPMGTVDEYEHRLEQVKYEAEGVGETYREGLERL